MKDSNLGLCEKMQAMDGEEPSQPLSQQPHYMKKPMVPIDQESDISCYFGAVFERKAEIQPHNSDLTQSNC